MKNIEDILYFIKDSSIFLTGFMGTGKSTIGRLLSRTLDIPFYDLDRLIEKQLGIVVIDIFKTWGEGNFRKVESQVLEALLEEPRPNVIALGGGALVSEVNRALVHNNGVLIALKADSQYVIPRLDESQIATLMMMTNRPLSDALFNENILSAVDELIEERKTVYDGVDFTVDSGGKTFEDVIDEILTNISNRLIS